MKRFSFLIAFSVLSFICMFKLNQANAQGLGGRIGVSLANIVGDDASDDNAIRTGLTIGGYGTLDLSEQLAIQPEVFYTQRGASDDEIDDLVTALDYIDVNILARYSFMERTEGFYAVAGPQIGILAIAENRSDDDDVDISDNISGIDFGLQVGVGYRLDSGFLIDARFNPGLSTVPDTDADVSSSNQAILVTLGYALQ